MENAVEYGSLSSDWQSHLLSSSGLYLICILLCAWLCVQYAKQVFRADMRSIPGPFLARLSPFYRAWMLRKGDAQEVYYNLHQKYGPIVRTAPGVVSISDPRTVPTIYGIGTKFYKVRSISRQLTMPGLHFYSFTFPFQRQTEP